MFAQFSTQIRILVDRVARQSGADAESADYVKTKFAGIVGRYLGDIIGANRLETRAKSCPEASFGDGTQVHTHSPQVNGKHHIMNCRMTPAGDRHHVLIGSLVVVRDMTRLYLGSESEYAGPKSRATATVGGLYWLHLALAVFRTAASPAPVFLIDRRCWRFAGAPYGRPG